MENIWASYSFFKFPTFWILLIFNPNLGSLIAGAPLIFFLLSYCHATFIHFVSKLYTFLSNCFAHPLLIPRHFFLPKCIKKLKGKSALIFVLIGCWEKWEKLILSCETVSNAYLWLWPTTTVYILAWISSLWQVFFNFLLRWTKQKSHNFIELKQNKWDCK